MHKPEFYRLQNQQANPTQQQMPTPIIRRITCERKNWRPFFHQMIQVWVEKMRELINIFYQARALRALGLLLADSAPTMGRGKTFWQVSRIFLRKQL